MALVGEGVGGAEKIHCYFTWKGASVWDMWRPRGQILIALASGCVSSNCNEPRCPPGGAGGTGWGIIRSDLCWLCDPWRSDRGPKDSSTKFVLKYDFSLINLGFFSMRFRVSGYKSVMTEGSLVRTSWNASSHRDFSFSPFHECLGQRWTIWIDQSSHLIPACLSTGGASQRNPSPIRSNTLSVNTGNAPHVETLLPNQARTAEPPFIYKCLGRPAIWTPSSRSDTWTPPTEGDLMSPVYQSPRVTSLRLVSSREHSLVHPGAWNSTVMRQNVCMHAHALLLDQRVRAITCD